ncbi:MAG: DNA repair protein RecO [Clostridia bacterium]|nr:DNA repair protein RecO [Clostridia bacterium]
MPAITTQAIVLRHADYREHDRMLTLLSPSMGRIEALCRGCKRPQSPLLSASEWFALGEYVLFAGKGHMTVTSCNLTESFFPLRTDYERLKHATYILSVTEAAAQPGEKAVELFTLLARSLSRLAYTDRDAKAVSTAFLLHFSAISGYRPRLSHCVRCGREMREEEIRLFDIENGGLLCDKCYIGLNQAHPVTPDQVKWMRDVLARGIDKTDQPPQAAPGSLLAAYVDTRLDKRIGQEGLYFG